MDRPIGRKASASILIRGEGPGQGREKGNPGKRQGDGSIKIQDMIETHKETEKLVDRRERTVEETNGLVAESKKVKSDTKERIEKTRVFIKKLK